MTTAIADRERIHEYTLDEFKDTLAQNGLEEDDHWYLAAVFLPTGIFEVAGEARVAEIPTKSLQVYYVDEGPTGFYQKPFSRKILVLNTEDILDYNLISDLHVRQDADAYLCTTASYEGGEDFERISEWFRDETYPDHFKEDKDD